MSGEVDENGSDLVANRGGVLRLANHVVIGDGHQQRMRAVALTMKLQLFVVLSLDGRTPHCAIGRQKSAIYILDVGSASPSRHQCARGCSPVLVGENDGVLEERIAAIRE